MIRTTTSIKINHVIIEHARSNYHISSLSEWIEEQYMKQFLGLRHLENVLEKQKADLALTEKAIAEFKELKLADLFNPKEIDWVKKYGLGKVRNEGFNAAWNSFFRLHPDTKVRRRQFELYCRELMNDGKLG